MWRNADDRLLALVTLVVSLVFAAASPCSLHAVLARGVSQDSWPAVISPDDTGQGPVDPEPHPHKGISR